MTVWACQQKYRREHHLKVQRLKAVYASTGAHKAVCEEILGLGGVGVRNLTRDAAAEDAAASGLAASESERLQLTGEELKRAIIAEDAREKERSLADKASLDTLYVPGTWRCSRCCGALAPNVLNCPNFVRVKGKKPSRFGTANFKRCGGSQSETWGGYVRGADTKPPPGRSRRDEEPNWRGKFTGGSHSRRAKAKTDLTTEESLGDVGLDPERGDLVRSVLEARAKVKGSRARKKQRVADAKRAAVMNDPGRWECPRCVEEFTDAEREPDPGRRDVYNESTRMSCWKCSTDRPAPGSLEAIRWKCPRCSTDDYTVCGNCSRCEDCDRPYNKKTDYWWRIPDPPAVASSSGGAGDNTAKKSRKRGGRKHKRHVPQSSDPGHAPDADADDDDEEGDDDEAPSGAWGQRVFPQPRGRKRSRPTAGGRGVASSLAVACVVTLPTMVRGVELLQPATVVPVGLLALLGLVCRRSYEAFDTVVAAVESSTVNVVAAVENTTVDLVEAVGQESARAVPVIFGVAVVLLLLWLNCVVNKFWKPRKEEMKEYGESPEGNAGERLAVETSAQGFPILSWLNKDVLARSVRNIFDA